MLAPIMANLGDGYEINVTAGLRGKSIAKLGIRNATAVGRIIGTSDLVRLYNNSDALLFPSRLEGLSFVLLEAMACGLPVIAARASSMPEVVVHDKTGFLCRPDDADDFADAIRRLAADRDRAMAMGDAGRQRIEEVYDERTVIPRYIELYRDTLSRSPGGVIS
jgi:glycosyltransferase involved in cell wall biosynthesis